MKDDRFHVRESDPFRDSHVDDIREQALQTVYQNFTANQTLRDDAIAFIQNDYNDMGASAFLEQLRILFQILDALANTPVFNKMQTLLVNLMRAGIHQVSGEALDAVTVGRDALQMRVDGKSTLIGSANSELLTILSLGKESREIQRQLVAIENLVEHRSDENLKAVGRLFKIPIYDTKRITQLIQRLFDGQGNYIRTTFEPMLDELVQHKEHAFELLWCYSKALEGRSNRVSFLNSLQHLISRINRPKHALRFLLADFCRDPVTVAPSDRNSIMLANILLRTYNKELDINIEMTPEEVLNVRNGLDRDVIRYAQFRIDSVEYRFAAKVHAIHEQMVALLNSVIPDQQSLSIRHLLFLEREILIFLALLSGKTAYFILVWALSEYGHPETGIHRHLRAATYLPVFLQHLNIIVRGLGRVGSVDDVALLRAISQNGPALSACNSTPENKRAVERTMQWIENTIRNMPPSTDHQQGFR